MSEPAQSAPNFFKPKHRIARPQVIAKEEDGFILLAVLFMLVIVLLTLAIAAPTVATDLRRDKEIETVHRGMQYARAIRIYYRKFGRYPNTLDQLMNTENQRFLRKRYLDPMTGKDDWRIIHLGESQLLANSAAGQLGTPAANMPGASSIGGNGIGNGSFGSSGTGISSSTPGFGSSSSGFGSSSSGFGGGSSFGSSSDSGSSGTGIGGTSPGGSSFGSTGTSSPSGDTGSGTGGSAFGTPGATVGGAPIVGVGLPSTKASIKIYKKQTHYNQWEFVYDPNSDLGGVLGQNGTGGVQQPGMTNGINGTSGIGGSSPGLGAGSSTGGFGGNSDSGSSPGFGGNSSGSPTPPANPTSPQ